MGGGLSLPSLQWSLWRPEEDSAVSIPRAYLSLQVTIHSGQSLTLATTKLGWAKAVCVKPCTTKYQTPLMKLAEHVMMNHAMGVIIVTPLMKHILIKTFTIITNIRIKAGSPVWTLLISQCFEFTSYSHYHKSSTEISEAVAQSLNNEYHPLKPMFWDLPAVHITKNHQQVFF